jgi:hypothetical protein
MALIIDKNDACIPHVAGSDTADFSINPDKPSGNRFGSSIDYKKKAAWYLPTGPRS